MSYSYQKDKNHYSKGYIYIDKYQYQIHIDKQGISIYTDIGNLLRKKKDKKKIEECLDEISTYKMLKFLL